MRRFFATYLLLFAGGFALNAQSLIDRKVIVEDGNYYYVKIHEYNQIGTLHVLKGTDLPDSGKAYALPAGRSYFEPVNPFSWDVADSFVYAISFLDHPLNDRNEALKRFEMSALKQWSEGVRPEELMMYSVDYNMYAYNEPYQYMIKQSNILEGFFFDAVEWKDGYWMVIANQGKLMVWKYNDGQWSHSELLDQPTNAYFSLVIHDDQLNLVTNGGEIYSVSIKGLESVKKGGASMSLNNGVLIEDRDKGKILFVEHAAFSASGKTIAEIIDQFGKQIF
jgi:hypothetical protein